MGTTQWLQWVVGSQHLLVERALSEHNVLGMLSTSVTSVTEKGRPIPVFSNEELSTSHSLTCNYIWSYNEF